MSLKLQKVEWQSLSHSVADADGLVRPQIECLPASQRCVLHALSSYAHTPQKSEDQTLADEHMQDTIVWEFSPISFLGTLA